MAKDFEGAFAALRAILREHAGDLVVQADTPDSYVVVTEAIGPNQKPLWFGAVLAKKSAVSFHLVPLYFNPVLQRAVPAELLARKQGKTCFNFQRPDPALFAGLDALTRTARATWERSGFLVPGPIAKETFDAALRAGGADPDAIARERKRKGREAAAKRAATAAAKGSTKKARRSAARAPRG